MFVSMYVASYPSLYLCNLCMFKDLYVYVRV